MILINLLDTKQKKGFPSKLLIVFLILSLGIFLGWKTEEITEIREMAPDEKAMVDFVLDSLPYSKQSANNWEHSHWWVSQGEGDLVTIQGENIILSARFFDLDPISQRSAFLPTIAKK